MKSNRIWFIMMMVAVSLPAFGQSRHLVIETNMATGNVFVDGVWLGMASQSPFNITTGAKRVIVSPRGGDAWSIKALSFDLSSEIGMSVTVDAHFPYYYKLESLPAGASVTGPDGSDLGMTPLVYSSPQPSTGVFRFSKPGYGTESATGGDEIWNHLTVNLSLVSSGSDVKGFVVDKRNRRWINYVAASTAIVSGIISISYRTKADNRFDDFNETGDRSVRSDIRRMDTYSGVALGVMQLGVGVIAFRLAF